MADSSEGFVVEEKPAPNSLVVKTNGVNYRSNNVWQTLKPLVNGFLTGQLNFLQFYSTYWGAKKMLPQMLPLVEELHGSDHAAQCKNILNVARKRMPVCFLLQATYTTAKFGSFDILTRKIEAANQGIRLTLYQEACCGLISGGIAACIWHPLNVASASLRPKVSQSVEKQFNYRNLFASLYHKSRSEGLFALWKGSGLYVTREMVGNMGLLTSYNRSFHYFRESVGMSKSDAQLGAGIVSAFFAVACSVPCPYFAAIKDLMQADGGRKYSYRDALFCCSQVFRPGGRFKIYSGIFRTSLQLAPILMLQWWNLEKIRELQESKGF